MADNPTPSLQEDDSSSHDPGDDARDQAKEAREAERKSLKSSDDHIIVGFRVAVIAVLVLTAAIVSVGAFLGLRADQEDDFENEFNAQGQRLIESFYKSVERKVENMDTLSVAYTSYALATGATFPNVTLPNIDIRMAGIRVLAETPAVAFIPLVEDEKTRVEFEAYMAENHLFYNEALASSVYQRGVQDATFGFEDDRPTPVDPEYEAIHITQATAEGFIPAEENSGPYSPVWQTSPLLPSKVDIGFDTMSNPFFEAQYKAVLNSGKATIEEASNLEGENTHAAYFRALYSYSQYRYDTDEWLGDPTSTFAYPVFDSFIHETRKVVGVLTSSSFWRVSLDAILAANSKGVYCVFKSTNDVAFTYLVDGSGATYLSSGDLHDTRYTDMGLDGVLSEYMESRTSPTTTSYTSVSIDFDYLDFTLSVYPTEEFESNYKTNAPLISFLVILGIFAFTSIIFILYDCFVRRRQMQIMERAIASGAIVSSLFPTQVKKQLYEENKEKDENPDKAWAERRRSSVGAGAGLVRSPRPIAEKYEHTTILFADLAGFTKWSSTRSPEQVFQLLEALYGAFDKVALRRKVFKVETIGDCYVAVTGLPDPQPDHAVIMMKFAFECMTKMSQLLEDLVDDLGADTVHLAMRVGCHSGAVTGGVLRGEKGRFQLFGDAMNTAARMESNGVKGRIHVSEATMKELVKSGKESWIEPRDGLIDAKGKGSMQTYWVTPSKTGTMYSSDSAETSFPVSTDQSSTQLEC